MGEWSDRLTARIIERLTAGARTLGDDMVVDVQQKISTPVIVGPLGGIIRSRPYEYPWLETGHLQESERQEVHSEAKSVTLRLINDAEYARRLHDGHDGVLPRPFHDLALVDWTPEILERARKAVIEK